MITHPIRRLPEEILDKVFLTVVQSQFKAWVALVTNGGSFGLPINRYSRPGHGATWQLSWVCSAWRKVVQSNSRLWSYMVLPLRHRYIHGPGNHPAEEEHTVRAKEAKLSRQLLEDFVCFGAMLQMSRKHNLHIVVDGAVEDISAQIVVLVNSSSYRWREIYAPWFLPPAGRAYHPHLSVLGITDSLMAVPGILPCVLSTQLAPKLRSIEISSKAFKTAAEVDAMLPLSQIEVFTHLNSWGSVLPWSEALILLSRLTIVERCRLHLTAMEAPDSTPVPGSTVRMKHLTDLWLRITPGDLPGESIIPFPAADTLTAPNLTSLHIDGNLAVKDVTAFIHSSGCPLRDMSYSTWFPNETAYVELIQLLPHSVVSLTLDMCSAWDGDRSTAEDIVRGHSLLPSLYEVEIPPADQISDGTTPKPRFLPNLDELIVMVTVNLKFGVPEDLRLEIACVRPEFKLKIQNAWETMETQ